MSFIRAQVKAQEEKLRMSTATARKHAFEKIQKRQTNEKLTEMKWAMGNFAKIYQTAKGDLDSAAKYALSKPRRNRIAKVLKKKTTLWEITELLEEDGKLALSRSSTDSGVSLCSRRKSILRSPVKRPDASSTDLQQMFSTKYYQPYQGTFYKEVNLDRLPRAVYVRNEIELNCGTRKSVEAAPEYIRPGSIEITDCRRNSWIAPTPKKTKKERKAEFKAVKEARIKHEWAEFWKKPCDMTKLKLQMQRPSEFAETKFQRVCRILRCKPSPWL
ncbi:hypothetical protein YB2330_004592 [Saitoella coloradoensis]